MSKRPDREQIAFAMLLHESGQDEAFLRRIWEGYPTEHPVKLNYYGLADAAISSLALEPEAREEFQWTYDVKGTITRIVLDHADAGQEEAEWIADEVMRVFQAPKEVPVEPSPEAREERKREAFRAMNAVLDANGGQDTAEYRAAFAGFERCVHEAPSSDEAEVVALMDGPRFRFRGAAQALTVSPVPGGWLVVCTGAQGEQSCVVPSDGAGKLARMITPEAREEPKHGLIEDYTAVQAPDWTKVSGKLDAREEARRKVKR